MSNGNKKQFYLKKILQGVLLTIIVFFILLSQSENLSFTQVLIYETLPGYKTNDNLKQLFIYKPEQQVVQAKYNIQEEDELVQAFSQVVENQTEENETTSQVIGLNDIIYQDESDIANQHLRKSIEQPTIADIDKMRDIEYLRKQFYVVDARTLITPENFNVDKFIATDLTINNDDITKPKILILHTHSQEKYIDTNGDSKDDTVGGVGEELANILTNKYGINTIHNTDVFDMVDGQSQIMGAYERMEPVIEKILKDNPTIEVVIDIHRDGVSEDTKLVTTINNKPTAEIMFFNGLSLLNENGVAKPITSLPNPYIDTNLALSFNMKLAANELYPDLTRKVYLNAYRYSLNMLPKSMLVEVGAQTNTDVEAKNAMEPLADILASVLLK